MTFCSYFDEKSSILGARGALAPVWGRVPKLVSKKTHFYSKGVSHFEDIFRTFRNFLTLDFSFIFEVTADSELCALWCRKVPKRRFPGKLFGAIPTLVAIVRMKLPFERQHRFRGFKAPKQRQISPLVPEGVRESSGAPFSYTFNDFG